MSREPRTGQASPEPSQDATEPVDAARPGGTPADEGAAADEGQETERPRRRRHRRAVGGTVPPGPEPRTNGPSPDDLDVGWGEQPSGSDDERFLREVPPHW
ncbi:hypothetical protein [Actinotalea sp.]|uniref:hypothetical protein n=1 Tax=Actinotalea sp. TaxID=1872145 RepID=UPI003569503A